jgi:hypothetical protein
LIQGEVGARESVVRAVPHQRGKQGTVRLHLVERSDDQTEAYRLAKRLLRAHGRPNADMRIDQAPTYGLVVGPEDVGGEIDERVRHGGVGPVEDARGSWTVGDIPWMEVAVHHTKRGARLASGVRSPSRPRHGRHRVRRRP